jgi:hypothetical protein
MLLSGILFVGATFNQNYSSQQDNIEKGYPPTLDSIIQENYAGDLTDDKITTILSDYLKIRVKDIQNEDQLSFVFYPFYWDLGAQFFTKGIPVVSDQLRESMDQGIQPSIVDFQINKVSELNFTKFETPLQLGNYVPWTDLFTTSGNIFILCSVILILIGATIFAADTSKNINQLLFTNKFGRKKMNKTKIKVSVVVSVVLFLTFQFINYLTFYSLFDLSGGISSIQTNFSMVLFDFPMEWSHWVTFLFILISQLLGIIFTVSITLFLSAISKTSMAAFANSLGIFFLPSLLTQLIKTGIGNQILQLFPINWANPIKLLEILSVQDYLLGNFILNTLLLYVFLLLTVITFILASYYKIKKWSYT